MNTQKFDGLNKLHTEYFKVMDISTEQMLERIEMAELLDDVFLYLFTYLDAEIKANSLDIDIAYDLATRRYIDAIEEYGINLDKYPDIQEYAINMARNLVDSTVNGNNQLSIEERSVNVAQNESNSIFNRFEYDRAIDSGKKYKTWLTEGDKKVRDSHKDVDMMKLAIDEPFIVGGSQMMFPKDSSLGASVRELSGCRCSIVYT